VPLVAPAALLFALNETQLARFLCDAFGFTFRPSPSKSNVQENMHKVPVF